MDTKRERELRAQYEGKDDHDLIVETVVTLKGLAETVKQCVECDKDHEKRLTVMETHWKTLYAVVALIGAVATVVAADLIIRVI